MTATISEAEFEAWLPFRFQEITDPLAAAEPSRGALLRLDSGQYFVVYWGHDSGQLMVRIPEAVEPSFFLASFLNEVPLPRGRITWIRDGVRLPRARPVTPAPPPRKIARMRALIVEDDSSTRDGLRRLLENEGLVTDVAHDGEEAVGALVRDYDVILLDIALPKISGTDVLEYLCATGRPHTLERVIVVTGLNVHEIRETFPTVAAVLSKPILPLRLLDAVRALGSDDDYAAEPQVS